MLVPFEQLPENARVWVYQSNRPFTEEELPEVKSALEEFVKEWTSHGNELSVGCDIKYNRFIVIGVDEDFASLGGCSIDTSIHFIQKLQDTYQVDLLDRMNVSFRQGAYIAYKDLADFKKMVKDRSVSPKTVVFNNLVTTKGEFDDYWEIPMEESWHKRFL